MPSTSYRPIIDIVVADAPGSLADARADYTRVARRLGALLTRIDAADRSTTVEELASLEEVAWELARSLSFAVGRISGVESAKAFVLSAVTDERPACEQPLSDAA
jgi:sirohydrochlorin ferrochelatase